MKYTIFFLPFLFVLSTSCTTINESNVESKDTTIHLLFSDSSQFGTEIYADYRDGVLVNCNVKIKKATCENLIRHIFLEDSILVTEDILFYEYPIRRKQEYNIDTIMDELIDSVYTVKYILDYKGNVIWISDSMASMTFFYHKLQSLVPLEKNTCCGESILRNI